MDQERLADFARWCGWFYDNLPSGIQLEARDYARMVEEYQRDLHPWEVSSAIAEGRETSTESRWGRS